MATERGRAEPQERRYQGSGKPEAGRPQGQLRMDQVRHRPMAASLPPLHRVHSSSTEHLLYTWPSAMGDVVMWEDRAAPSTLFLNNYCVPGPRQDKTVSLNPLTIRSNLARQQVSIPSCKKENQGPKRLSDLPNVHRWAAANPELETRGCLC